VDAAYSAKKEPGIHRSITDQVLRLTKDEAQELNRELSGVLQDWMRRTRGRDPARRTYHFFSILQPHPDTGAGEAEG
jgi:hypothetical protein